MIRQTILHSNSTNITAAVVAAAGVMGMDKAECSINRIPPVRHRLCRDSSNYEISAPLR
jgi:hypothetical protein